jgi:GNAT superfamily N-acetyltransferase
MSKPGPGNQGTSEPGVAGPGGGLVLRHYEKRDADQVMALHLEGLRDTGAYYPAGAEPGESPWDADLKRIEETYLGPGCNFWVIEDRSRLIAMTAVQRIDDSTAQLKRMRVARDRRRMGLGQALLDAAEQFCRSHGYRRIVLDTTDRQQAARRLYEKNGYGRTGERRLGEMLMIYYEKRL